MTDYLDTVKHRANRARKQSQKAAARAETAHQKHEALLDQVPFGQPILVGHHSEGRHRRLLQRADRLIGKSIEESEYSEALSRTAQHHDRHARHIEASVAASAEDYQTGEVVVARFTNSNRVLEIIGEIKGRTLNFWKIHAPSPYPGETREQIWRIPCEGRPKHSANNSIQRRAS